MLRVCLPILLVLTAVVAQEGEESSKEATSGLMQCKICEDVVKHILVAIKEAPLGETVRTRDMKRSHKATLAARAHDIVDNACDASTTFKSRCPEVVGQVEDELIEFILSDGKSMPSSDLCLPVCTLKRTLKKTVSDMQKKLVRDFAGGTKAKVMQILWDNSYKIGITVAGLFCIIVWLQWKVINYYERKSVGKNKQN